MTATAASWYENGTLWTIIVGALVGIGAGWLTAWATLRASNPKRVLWYGMTAFAMLDTHVRSGSLRVTHAGQDLNDPYVVTVYLRNAGSRDVSAQNFHGEDPIIFDLGVPVKEILSVSAPNGIRPPEVELADWTVIAVKPCLIKKKTYYGVSILVEGSPEVTVQASLLDVEWKYSSDVLGVSQSTTWRGLDKTAMVLALSGFGFALVSMIFGSLLRD